MTSVQDTPPIPADHPDHPDAPMRARKLGRAGWLTFNRPKALNALDGTMAKILETALDAWRDDPDVDLVLIDAEGPRAFCAGGDIAAIYHAGRAGNMALGPEFWRDEYRMNAKIKTYPKPIVAFMQGFVMGGGVGVGGHCSHRVVGETSQIAMPETGIGLIPDVGGTLILALAPGRLGEYLGVCGARIGAADALLTGFADRFLPEARWPAIKDRLAETGDIALLPAGEAPPAPARLAGLADAIAQAFAGADIVDIRARLQVMAADPGATGDFARDCLATMARNSALSQEATLRLVRLTRAAPRIEAALSNEFRFTLRALPDSDFLEGVRAQIIEKDRNPTWRWQIDDLASPAVQAHLAGLLAPLPPEWQIDFGAAPGAAHPIAEE